MTGLTVSKLGERVGISPDALRYYERIGLLPKPDRSATGYRLYGDDAVERVEFIKGAKRLGLRLDEIGELLRIRENGLCPCGRTRQLLDERLVNIDDEIAALVALRGAITRMIGDAPVAQDGECRVSFLEVGGNR